MEKEKPICWVCKREKKPYIVFLDSNILSIMQHFQAREKGEICERCNQYSAMTGEFKDATEEEFDLALKSSHFAYQLLEFWQRDKQINPDGDNSQDWMGTDYIKKWFRERYKQKGGLNSSQLEDDA